MVAIYYSVKTDIDKMQNNAKSTEALNKSAQEILVKLGLGDGLDGTMDKTLEKIWIFLRSLNADHMPAITLESQPGPIAMPNRPHIEVSPGMTPGKFRMEADFSSAKGFRDLPKVMRDNLSDKIHDVEISEDALKVLRKFDDNAALIKKGSKYLLITDIALTGIKVFTALIKNEGPKDKLAADIFREVAGFGGSFLGGMAGEAFGLILGIGGTALLGPVAIPICVIGCAMGGSYLGAQFCEDVIEIVCKNGVDATMFDRYPMH